LAVKINRFFPLFAKMDRGINPLFNLQSNNSGENEKIAREQLSRIHDDVTCHRSEAYRYNTTITWVYRDAGQQA